MLKPIFKSIMPINTKSDIQEKITRAREEYPSLWRQFIQDWRSNRDADHAWLMYSANYLFHTSGVRWALDPFSLSTRIKGFAEPDFAADLAPLELVALTHAHNDHLDLNLIRSVAHLPILWVVPGFMLDKILAAGVSIKNIIVPVNGLPIQFRGLTLTPFSGQHIHGHFGLPETGYLAECGSRRWLFPGDTRVYDPAGLPKFGPVDAVFAHVWLGKACADLLSPPLLAEFCRFYRACEPKRILLTHLNELGRGEKDLWDERHVELIRQELRMQHFYSEIEAYFPGTKINMVFPVNFT